MYMLVCVVNLVVNFLLSMSDDLELNSEEAAYFKKLVRDFHVNTTIPGVIGVAAATVLAIKSNLLPRHPKVFIYPKHLVLITGGTFILDAYLGQRSIIPKFNEKYPGTMDRIKQNIGEKANQPNSAVPDSALSPDELKRLSRKYENDYLLSNTLPVGFVGSAYILYRHYKGTIKPLPNLPPWINTLQVYYLGMVFAVITTHYMFSPMYARMMIRKDMMEKAKGEVAPVITQVKDSAASITISDEESVPGEEEGILRKKTYEELRRDNRLGNSVDVKREKSPTRRKSDDDEFASRLKPKSQGNYGDEGWSKG